MLKRLLFASLAYALAAPPAHASFLSGETLDTAADILAIVVLFLVPVVGDRGVLDRARAAGEDRRTSATTRRRDAITTLCLLSLVFGGLLWPLAWLWAYTKPVGYRVAYGTDKHDDYFDEMAEKHRAGKLLREEACHLREELEAMEARGALPPKLRALKDELAPAARRSARAADATASGGEGGGVDGSPAARHLLVLRLADLHQVEVAAVEHRHAGHRRRSSRSSGSRR